MGQVKSQNDENSPPFSEHNARDWLFRRLTLREHSRAELRKGLIERGFSRTQSEVLLDSFAESGYQSDERYQAAYARHQAKQGKGTRWIQMKLKEKGVEASKEELAEIAEEATGATELDRAVDFLRRRYDTQLVSTGTQAQKDRMRIRNRLLGGLVRRGFSFGIAQQAFQIFEKMPKNGLETLQEIEKD